MQKAKPFHYLKMCL